MAEEKIFSEEDIKSLKDMFDKSLKDTVEIDLYLDYEKNKETSEFAKRLSEELIKLTDKIKFNYYDTKDSKVLEDMNSKKLLIDKYGNRKGPIFVFKKYYGAIYYGIPSGEEFPIFLEDIIHISNNNFDIDGATAKKLDSINKNIDIYVFVTPTCPYCPYMTHNSHQFAMVKSNIRGIMIESYEFPEFSEHYKVYGVPHITIVDENSDTLTEWEGMLPEPEMFADRIREAIEQKVK
ncbi:glutaredoxin [Nanobdella aerobiophila]|uniref:Glutaredoxin n=1 Tax=Nanobdella aerobiophila TaxID=2586965 RepID=A0A915WRJ0_9ARCH|nr:thioredoxin family protein [Nanobdella aerobiophila]BBL45693.1 glutaredoxin [Nanobdella aerobiophila]